MRLFIDTHDQTKGTFPKGLTPEGFEGFYVGYEQACAEEGVIIIRTHVGYAEGRAFCLNMAPDAEAVRRAHEKAGLPFDSITEVSTASPTDSFFRRPAAE
ncbi:DUF4242 domain-containing protein [Rhodospirillum sp. A1_3_36]|uniref:DUF4242 domain-containing protein n=1 Tax=Rhodospirillum sp. A1_3_36 TaxID=3391666 RepID=UPI0039A449DE